MANPGAGNKFVSVNLNKSYGKFTNSASYGARVRSGGQIGGGGGGGGMVVLSRPRSSQKTGQKLSVPSPVNLPSMRKEHEKFDSSGASGGLAGDAAGSNSRPSSAGMGWTKPAVIVVQEKSNETLSDVVGGTTSNVEGASKLGSVYMPPARLGSSADVTSSSQLRSYSAVEKAAILRGEDFPSLHTSLSSSTGNAHKQKDGTHQKSKQLPTGDLSSSLVKTVNIDSVDIHPQGRTSQKSMGYGSSGNDVRGPQLSGSRSAEESQKQESYIHGAFHEVRLNPRSDWADDERDTGQVFTDRSRNHGSLSDEGYWDRDFEKPRGSFMPPKPTPNVFNKWGQRNSETGKVISGELFKVDSYNRDARPNSREGRDHSSWNNPDSHGEGRDTSSWRNPSVSFTRSNPQEHTNKARTFGAEPLNMKGDNENKFVASPSMDRKNPSFIEGGRQRWNNYAEPSALQGSDRHRSSSFQNSSPVKSTFSHGGKGLHVNDPLLNFSKVKKPLANTEDLSLEDPFNANGYDGINPFSGGLVGVVKRKKDLPKLTELHDPARESFEAELERVQKMQEQERQRAFEEQERAMMLARTEEEERLRQVRDREEMKRRLDEAAREAAWRAEQEQLQAIQKAEEQRITRESEKQRMQIEEERRKQAANQKLLELEERIARRQAEAMRDGDACAVGGSSAPVKEKETSRAADISDWEDGEKMVERITTSASSDSSGLNRFVDSSSGHHSFTDSSAFPGRGKSINPQRKDAYENEGSSNTTLLNQESSSARDVPFHPKKSLTRKDLYRGSVFMYPQNHTNAGVLNPDVNDTFQTRGQKWNFPGDSNPEIDAEIHERLTENLGDSVWGGNLSSHPTRPIYQDRHYQNPELGEVYSFSRPRYSTRQPRVLPPPSIYSMNRTLNRGETERPSLSTSLDRVMDSNYVRDSGMLTGYDNVRQESLENPEMAAFRTGQSATRDQLLEGNDSIRCDSQSSLSVTSPPSSPAYLSHEDLEDSRGTPGSSADADEKVVRSSSTDPAIRNHSFLTADDEEWMVESHENLQQQEVYDEGGEYQEGDEAHAEDAAGFDLKEEFRTMNIGGKDSPRVSENLILGFNEGIEVGMPSDESESNQDQNSKISTPFSKNHADSLGIDEHVRDQSSTQMQKLEEQTGDLAIHANVNLQTSTDLTEAAACSGKPLPSFTGDRVSQSVTSSMPPAPNTPEVPVKLQFGLFSGPSLIPAPVPSIQIGSIQMPLHLHPPVGSSFPHQSGSLFHFGHLRYNNPISQGILPLAPQAVSFVQPPVPSQSANCSPAVPMSVQPVQQYSHSQTAVNDDGLVNNRKSFSGNNIIVDPGSSNSMKTDKRHDLDVKIEDQLPHGSTPTDPISSMSGGQVQSRVTPHRFSKERAPIRSKAPGPVSGGRGREIFSSSRSFGTRPSNIAYVVKFQRNDQQGGNQLQINSDRRIPGTNDKMNFGPRSAKISSRNGSRRGVFSEKVGNQNSESNLPVSTIVTTKDVTSGSNIDKGSGNNISIVGHGTSLAAEVRHKRNIEADIYATLQSGVVRVYDQPGIEVPSDEDDFIEVRSKRQMLNDRREQREKDNKAKFRVTKNLQKPRFSSETRALRNSNKISSSTSKGPSPEAQSSFVATESRSQVKVEASVSVDSTSPLAPLGTPSILSDVCFEKRSQSIKSVQAGGLSDVSTGQADGPGSLDENNCKTMENVEASLGPWNNVWVNQQVMPLTQSELDEAMNPVRVDPHGPHLGKSSGSGYVAVSSSSSLVNGKSFSTSPSPVNSLLDGKKIQFGAVTSPSIIPGSRAVSQGVGASRSEQVSHELSASENVHSVFNDPEKQPKEYITHIDVNESEILAASAVAGAANDILGSRSSRSDVSDPELFKQASDDGNSNDQKSSSQSRTEESLSVSLPADLSIEMSPISVWQPPQSPQNAPHHMLSHFPGGHPSHFPIYEMNPLVGGPVFAVRPPDDASGSQTQSQNNNTTVSTPLGPWMQRHPGPESFYGHPAGFPPFISQSGGILGAQGPPHMVVYNHFAPVGQFGQVGLSFTGTTYVPSGKQPDWKHNPTSSAMAVGDENINMGIDSGQHICHNIPAPIQHLSPGPSLLPVAPAMAMFDASPYQSSSGSTRWSHIPPQHLQSMPQLLPVQPHPERFMHSQLGNGTPPNTSTASGNNYPLNSSDASVSKFQAELGVVESSGSAPFDPSVSKMSDTNVDAGKIGSSQSDGRSQSITSTKSRAHQQKHAPFQHHNHSTGFNHRRGDGSSHRNSSGGVEWPNRRGGYHSRPHSSSAADMSAKVKQIYVAKQPVANATAASGT